MENIIRDGSVLNLNTILKKDHFSSMNKPLSQTSLVGAPNYRNSKINIHGVAQCSFAGAASVLSFIRSSSTNPIYWFSAREEPLVYINSFPYVLRDTSSPLQNIKRFLGINSLRLEQMEDRLKLDVINEAARYKGLLLVHDEHDSNIIPTWTCVLDVQTPRQIFDKLNELGYNVNYFRIPISPEQAPDDLYLDEYMAVINKTNPNDPLVFNCGMGIGRTTFAMVSAMIIRRKIMLRDDLPDPFPDRANSYASLDILGNDDYDNNRTMLRLVFILENGLKNKFERSVIGWALERGPLIEDLKSAVLGNYQIILQLTSVLSKYL